MSHTLTLVEQLKNNTRYNEDLIKDAKDIDSLRMEIRQIKDFNAKYLVDNAINSKIFENFCNEVDKKKVEVNEFTKDIMKINTLQFRRCIVGEEDKDIRRNSLLKHQKFDDFLSSVPNLIKDEKASIYTIKQEIQKTLEEFISTRIQDLKLKHELLDKKLLDKKNLQINDNVENKDTVNKLVKNVVDNIRIQNAVNNNHDVIVKKQNASSAVPQPKKQQSSVVTTIIAGYKSNATKVENILNQKNQNNCQGVYKK